MDFKRLRELEKKGIIIDGLLCIIITMGVSLLIPSLLITDNIRYIFVAKALTMIILFVIYAFIEHQWGPFSNKIIYQTEYEQEKKEIEAFGKLPINFQR